MNKKSTMQRIVYLLDWFGDKGIEGGPCEGNWIVKDFLPIDPLASSSIHLSSNQCVLTSSPIHLSPNKYAVLIIFFVRIRLRRWKKNKAIVQGRSDLLIEFCWIDFISLSVKREDVGKQAATIL